jgi:hypothetical protein
MDHAMMLTNMLVSQLAVSSTVLEGLLYILDLQLLHAGVGYLFMALNYWSPLFKSRP